MIYTQSLHDSRKLVNLKSCRGSRTVTSGKCWTEPGEYEHWWLRCYEGRKRMHFTVVRKEEFYAGGIYPTGGAMSAVLGTDAELIECNLQ